METTSDIAVLWDMDGVLVDSEPVLFEAERLTFADYGIDLTPELKKPFIGMGGHEVMELMAHQFGVNADPRELTLQKFAHIVRLLPTVRPFPQAVQLVELLSAQGIPMAVASGSSNDLILTALTAIGVADLLAIRVSAFDVPQGKPAPDVFLEAAQRIGHAPESCVVIEDAVAGVLAAKSAGMRCIAIPYTRDPWDTRFEEADLVVREGMGTMKPRELLEWILEQH
ncbi:HAD family hydrolase [Microbacterium enclense]|uniref:Haloacid dehalogenase superfamily, subfamily IA, variant 3 with third motif having DD or ED n=1 Tax=Microbacterium enclense TaxID=993073 RepID=A0A1G6GLH2_9MICO|nr:HAD family phosphatase [Microbacterium enclense]KSU56332.1 hypothetical protein AS029_00790 [Microbacterium enclense]SDB82703.1 haloacid dehalogenase superfamily, subfamily IA, variant 3 with third motif having DD or ED [Microbacterium enclense]